MFGIFFAILCAGILVRLWRRPGYGPHAYGYYGRPGPCDHGRWQRGPWRDDAGRCHGHRPGEAVQPPTEL